MKDYDALHKEWDIVHFNNESPTYKLRKKIILQTIYRLFPEKREYTCLDVGCGTGDYSLELARRNFHVQGFDFSQYAIDKARKKAEMLEIKNAHFQRADLFQFTTHEKFNLVLISEVLEHIEDDMSIFQKYSAYLKDSGYIIFSVPFNQRLWSYEDEWAGHIRRYSLERINEMVRNSDMHIVVSSCYGFPLLHILWRIKPLLPRSKSGTNVTLNFPKSSLVAKYVGRVIVLIDSLCVNSVTGVGIVVTAQNNSHSH